MGKLINTQLKKLSKKKGRHADSEGLYLVVRERTPDPKSGEARYSAKWYHFYFETDLRTGKKKRVEKSIGSYPELNLANARDKVRAERKALEKGIDPKAPPIVEKERAPLFGDKIEEFLEKRIFKTDKTKSRWLYGLNHHAKALHDKPMDEITLYDVTAILKPLWTDRHVTSKRVRRFLESYFSYARGQGWIDLNAVNPATWQGNLEGMGFQASKDVHTVSPHRALDWRDAPQFWKDLEAREAITAQLVMFILLTACRSNEARGAKWQEIDTEARIWSIPPERMKMKKAHRVPLSAPAMAILERIKPLSDSGFIFAAGPKGKPLSYNAPRAMFMRMGWHEKTTLHGTRSAFKSYATEAQTFDRMAVEKCLAHEIQNKVEAAYLRGDLLEKRVVIMDKWAQFVTGETASKVIQLAV